MIKKNKPKLLLHICCGPCATVAARRLMDDYEVVLFFYNPNIEPTEEWQVRLESAKKLAEIYGLLLVVDDSGVDDWLALAKPLSTEPERGRRCYACYEWRLRQTAQRAEQEDCAYFATSLTVSPYKDKEAINRIGLDVADTVVVNYLATDFQKAAGYQQSIILSKQYGLYRQKYCGCQFSRQ
ncbi:epoxyqueuosine reductase QueH [Candidatus Falkowbacteria bacterium]|nr:epoxyqueuosine reductase QueH [Candidatus Falkowbacteria bacterium]